MFLSKARHFRASSAFAAALGILFIGHPDPALACASCGCSLSTDWESQGLSTEPGYRLDIRVDDINQNALFHGGHKAGINDYQADTEIEKYTHNIYTTVGFDYAANADWGVNVQVPFLKRWHATVPPGETDTLTSTYQQLADIRVVGRYQGLTEDKNIGLTFGIKLPTGSYNQVFADGSPLDRSLQPGTGTTDLILGGFAFDTFLENWGWFAQAQLQHPLAQREGYRPGATLTVNAGVRYSVNTYLIPQFQLIGVRRQRDFGYAGDPANNGGELIYASPGITLAIDDHWSANAFVQMPVYKMVNGLQLTPRYALTGSISFKF